MEISVNTTPVLDDGIRFTEILARAIVWAAFRAGAFTSCLAKGSCWESALIRPADGAVAGKVPLSGPDDRSAAEDPVGVVVGEDPARVDLVAHGEEVVEVRVRRTQ